MGMKGRQRMVARGTHMHAKPDAQHKEKATDNQKGARDVHFLSQFVFVGANVLRPNWLTGMPPEAKPFLARSCRAAGPTATA
jgi:hypothetical protein